MGFNEVIPSGKAVLNFYWPTGTGKSRGAEALAGELGFTFSKSGLKAELESKFMETAKTYVLYLRLGNHALLFFEVKQMQFWSKRLSSSSRCGC